MSLLEKLRLPISGVSPGNQSGLYHYLRQDGHEKSRIHLRIDPAGTGTLIVNADRILHLNNTAAQMARMLLEGNSDEAIGRALARLYKTDASRARIDAADLRIQLEDLVRPEGPCPVHELGLESTMPFTARPTAPYRMDLAVTYRCNNDCAHCYNARARTFPEMDTAHWKAVLDKLWDIGVPHIVFTGGEPTLRDDLPELVAYAESKGQIAGLNTNGRRLADARFVNRLVDAGLDHLQVTVESSESGVHDGMVGPRGAFEQTIRGLRNALKSPLFVMTNTTMLRTNVETLAETLDFLADVGVPTIGLNALIYSGRGATVGTGLKERELGPILDMASAKTASRGQRLIWYTPTQYCEFDPTLQNLGVKGCTAALYSMCVEPNGDVLPCQSYYEPLGNLLADPWEGIWCHKLAVGLRERREIPQKCDGCALLPACGAGCPLASGPAPTSGEASPQELPVRHDLSI
jgi:radical SAM protein with 4Fe4S-binding SPASM domain